MADPKKDPCLPKGLPTSKFVTRPGRRRPPTPPPPVNGVCCPCTNLIVHGGFDRGTAGQPPPPPWVTTGNVELVGFPFAHSGALITLPDPSVLSARVGVASSLCQRVAVDPGCCYTLTFAASARAQGELIATVQFFTTPPAVCAPPTDAEIVAQQIPNIVAPGPTPQATFDNFTLVVCAPAGATAACVCFRNRATVGEGSVVFLDNVVFQPTGGPCPQCVQQFG